MNIKKFLFAIVVTLVWAPATTWAEQGEWGGLTGTFRLKGEPPKKAKIDPGNDQACCQANPQDESVVVGEKGELANVVVYLQVKRGDKPKVHPDLAEPAKDEVELDNAGCAFKPHVVLVRAGQTLRLKNTDATNHNVKAKLGADTFNFMVPAKGEQTVELDTPQRVPCEIACSIHPFMQGWILVRDNPYMAASDKKGKFALEKLPAGTHEFQFWHERAGYLKNVAIGKGKTDRRGRLELTVPPSGKLDLGEIEIDASLLKEKS